MADAILRGDAVAVKRVLRLTPGTIRVGAVHALRINSHLISVTPTTTAASDLVDLFVSAIASTAIPEFREIVASVDEDNDGRLILTGRVAGNRFELETLVDGYVSVAVIVLTIGNSPSGGTWIWTDATLGAASGLAHNISTSALQTALEALYGAGNVTVTGTAGSSYTVTFAGTRANSAVPTVTIDATGLTGGNAALSVTTTQTAATGTNEYQTITGYGSPTGGTWTVSFGGYTTSPLAHNISSSALQTALQALPSIGSGNCAVTGSALAFQVQFIGALASRAVELMTVDGSLLTGGTISGAVTTTTPGAAAINQLDYLTIHKETAIGPILQISRPAAVSGGTWTLTVNLAGGSPLFTTAAIAWNAQGHEIAEAVETALAVDGVCVASPTSDTSGNVTLRLVGTKWNAIVGSASINSASLVGGSYTVNLIAAGSGDSANITGTFTLSVLGQTTAAIDTTATAGQIQAALEALSTVGSGGVVVTAVNGNLNANGTAKLAWAGQLAGLSFSVTVNKTGLNGGGTGTAWRFRTGGAGSGAHEVQSLALAGSPSGGTFTLDWNGQTTSALAHNATASQVQAALEALSNLEVGDVVCTGGALPGSAVTITFGGRLKYTDVVPVTVNDSDLKLRNVETTPGVTGRNEIQRLSLTGLQVWGGTFALVFGGNTTSALNWNATASQVDAALEALASLGAGTIAASGGPLPETPIDVEFTGSKANTDVALLTVTSSTLKNGTITKVVTDPIVVTIVTEATGPNFWNDATNWSTGRVPDCGDTVWLTGDVDLTDGLRQLCAFTVDASNDWLIPTGGSDLTNGQTVKLTNSGGALPGGLASGTTYYVVQRDGFTGKFKLSTTAGGAAVNITSAGTGTHTIGCRIAKLYAPAAFTAELGRPRMSDAGYWEYRATHLQIGCDSNCAIIVGQGDGSGSRRFQVDTMGDAVTLEVLKTSGGREADIPALLWRGTAGTTAKVLGGEVGLCWLETETGALALLEQRDGSVAIGDCALTAIDKTGGELQTRRATALSGTFQIRG